jgi:AcrR family transcriptional regulator
VQVPPRVKRAASSGVTSQSARDRLADALSTLISAPARPPNHPTVSSLCRLASVSRNTLYRYYTDMANAVRRLRQRGGPRRRAAQQNTLNALRVELATLRGQLTQLATLADHYHTAAEELRGQLARRERANLPRRTRPTPLRIHR